MPLFTQYTKPGVYTSVIYEEGGVSLFGDARIPVLIGEGQETKKLLNQEIHRGSSATSDEQKVLENLSHQITGTGRAYQLTYAPVVSGNGQGVVTNLPSAIEAYTTDPQGNLIPLRITSLDGATGKFMTQDILPADAELKVSYFFKRMDQQVVAEDLSFQIPAHATFTGQTGMVIGTTLPGIVGNGVKLAFTLAAVSSGVADALAVTGAGTNLISIELRKTDNSVRTLAQIQALIEAGVATKTAGFLTVVSLDNASKDNAGVAVASTFFTGGQGQNTAKTFKVKNTPIVDGSNGGVVLNLPSNPNFEVKVNGAKVPVASMDGFHGLFTLVNEVKTGDVLTVSYFYNTYQDTYDELPAENVVDILAAGYAPGRQDFINTVDYVLVDNKIHWGNVAQVVQGKYTPGYTPFDASVVNTTLWDEKVYLRPCQGQTDGVNVAFTLEDVPTDGSLLSHATDNPDLIRVYVGTSPVDAMVMGPVRVIRLDGKTKGFTLYNPPAAGKVVYATYWRNILNDHSFTFEVTTAGPTGQGAYKITDEMGNNVPVLAEGSHNVLEADFNITKIVWPFAFSDLRGVAGQTPDETITLTFQDDGLTIDAVPAIQATTLTAQVGLQFRSFNPGVAPNTVTTVKMSSDAPGPDATAVSKVGEVVTVNINREDPGTPGTPHPTNPTRSLGDIIALFANGVVTTPLTGHIIAELATPSTDPNILCVATPASPTSNGKFSGGAAAVSQPYSNRFKVSSSRTSGDALADGKGRTGGATTDALAVPSFQPLGAGDTPGTSGWLGQTYMDVDTGVTFTIVDPNAALDYGYTELPSPGYYFRPGDKLVFTASNTAAHKTSVLPQLGIYGVRTQVTTTYGMNVGDTLLVNTYNKSGNEPKIGEYYYVNLLLGKTDKAFEIPRYYTNLSDIYAEFGDPTPENRLSLGAKLMFQNGASIITMKQVKKETGLETASDQTYMDAIADLALPLPGSDRKCDVIIPMTTSPVVIQFLAKHLNTQASPRMRGEAIGFAGCPMYATPESARSLARSIASERLILLYPGGAILSVDINNISTEFAVDGSFLAAAMAGLYLNPANDVATTLTRQKIVGFSRLVRRTAEPILDLCAADGVCILIERDGAFEVRHYMTTSTDNILKREPTTTTIVDYTRQRMRRALEQFIGRKSVQAVVTDISVTAHSLLRALIEQEILESYRSLEVTRDKEDPTVVHLTVAIKPIFSVLWVDVQFRVTTKG